MGGEECQVKIQGRSGAGRILAGEQGKGGRDAEERGASGG